MMRNVLVIGATSSLAQTICRTLAAKGYGIILSGRDEEELQLLACDLATRYSAHGRVVEADLSDPGFSAADFITETGDFDYAILAAGDMGSGDNTDPANIAHVTHINYTVPAQIAAAAAAYLAAKGGGTIAIISSVAGDRGRQSNYAYGSAKAALTAFASGLRNRYYKQNVQVVTIKPGFIDTPMTWGMASPLIASRECVAGRIIRAMETGQDIVYIPFFWRYIMLIICHIPEIVFKRLSL